MFMITGLAAIYFEPLYLTAVAFYDIPASAPPLSLDYFWEDKDYLHYLNMLLAPGNYTLRYRCPEGVEQSYELEVVAPINVTEVLCKRQTVAILDQAPILFVQDSTCANILGKQLYGVICLDTDTSSVCTTDGDELRLLLEDDVEYRVIYRIDAYSTEIVYFSSPTLKVDAYLFDLPILATVGKIDLLIGVILNGYYTISSTLDADNPIIKYDCTKLYAIFLGESSENYYYFRVPDFGYDYYQCFFDLLGFYHGFKIYLPVTGNKAYFYYYERQNCIPYVPEGIEIVSLSFPEAYRLNYQFEPLLANCRKKDEGIWVWLETEGIWLDNGKITCNINEFACDMGALC